MEMAMDASEAHLESVLAELNDRVNTLEEGQYPEELMEAYTNRGSVLQMLGYRTSALDDLMSAMDISEDIEGQGGEVDAGTFVKMHVTAARILFEMDQDPSDEYRTAASRLDRLDGASRHFDDRSVVKMCIDAANDLLDAEHPEDALVYIGKGISAIGRKNDHWRENRRFDLLNLDAEAMVWLEKEQEASESYSQAIEIGLSLMEEGALEEPTDLAMTFAAKADVDGAMGMEDMRILDLKSSVTVMENLHDCGRLPDADILVGLHQDLAEALMKSGNIAEAEKHLIRAMELGVNGAGDYMRIQTPNGKSS